MKVIHRIGVNIDDNRRRVLGEMGIPVPSNNGFFSFDLEEGTERLIRLKPYMVKWQLPDMIRTVFTKQELDSATYLTCFPLWTNGYPMPDDGLGYIATTYQKQGYCKVCGTGSNQQSPFRMRKTPNWGSKKTFGLNWVFDEIFVRKDVFEMVFEKYGIEAMPVLLYKKDSLIEDTVQLIIPSTTVPSDLKGQPYEICKTCGIKKYNPEIKGFFPRFTNSVSGLHMFKGVEYFGSGANAYKQIFVSQALRQEMLKYQIKLDYVPVIKNDI